MKKSLNDSQKPELSYNPEFVNKILESRKQFEHGRHRVIAIQDLWVENDADLNISNVRSPNDGLLS